MSGKNGMGPMEMGPMTGRNGGINQGRGLGIGRGRGIGRGARQGRNFRHCFTGDCRRGYSYPGIMDQDDKILLSQQEIILESQLKQIKERLETLNQVSR